MQQEGGCVEQEHRNATGARCERLLGDHIDLTPAEARGKKIEFVRREVDAVGVRPNVGEVSETRAVNEDAFHEPLTVVFRRTLRAVIPEAQVETEERRQRTG